MKTTQNTTLSISKEVGSELQIPLSVCEMFVTEFFKKVKKCLKEGKPVVFTGLGSLCVKRVKSRNMFNVSSQSHEMSKEKDRLRFKQSKVLDIFSS